MRAAFMFVLVLLAAGCVSVPDGASIEQAGRVPPGADPFNGLGDPLVLDHDHNDVALHQLASPSMGLLSHNAFEDVGAATLAFGEADLLGDKYAVFAGFLGTGFVIADISDPANMRGVSFTPDPGMMGDVKSSTSGNFVFVGRQVGQWEGIQAYNVMVPERPVPAGAIPVVGTMPFRGGCHMLAVHGDFIYCAPNDNTVRIFHIIETPAAVILEPAGIYAPQGEPLTPLTAGEDSNGEMTHDMTVQDDPLTGKPVMYVSFWNYGLRVVDVSDPANPAELGAWLGEGAEATYGGNIHTAMGGLVDGKRVVVVVPEYADVPSVTFIDATDYSNMTALGVWAPKPADAWDGQARTFSTHNIQFIAGKLYLAMYHGGVWVIDASSAEKLANPLPVGYYLPAEAPRAAVPLPFGGGGTSVWDVLVKDGVIFATNMPTGVFAIQLDADVGKMGLTSFA